MTLELAHLGKMFKASIAQWAPEPSTNANGFNGCSCQKYKHVHTHTHGWERGEAVGFKMMKDSSNSQISGGEIGQKKKKALWWTGGGGTSLTSALAWEPRGCSGERFSLLMMWMDSESREVEEAMSFIKHCLHNVASRGALWVFTNHAAGWGSQGSVLTRGKAATIPQQPVRDHKQNRFISAPPAHSGVSISAARLASEVAACGWWCSGHHGFFRSRENLYTPWVNCFKECRIKVLDDETCSCRLRSRRLDPREKRKKVSTNGVKLQSTNCQVFYLPPTLVTSQYFWNNMNNIGKTCQTSVGLI